MNLLNVDLWSNLHRVGYSSLRTYIGSILVGP